MPSLRGLTFGPSQYPHSLLYAFREVLERRNLPVQEPILKAYFSPPQSKYVQCSKDTSNHANVFML